MENVNFAEVARQNRRAALTALAARRAKPEVATANHDFAPMPVVPMAVSYSGRLHLAA